MLTGTQLPSYGNYVPVCSKRSVGSLVEYKICFNKRGNVRIT
jgi:hypothetical protein